MRQIQALQACLIIEGNAGAYPAINFKGLSKWSLVKYLRVGQLETLRPVTNASNPGMSNDWGKAQEPYPITGKDFKPSLIFESSTRTSLVGYYPPPLVLNWHKVEPEVCSLTQSQMLDFQDMVTSDSTRSS